jgi:cell division initiation protein
MTRHYHGVMDVSPKTLREVEFREKMRGYHPEDVDQFLERVAAGIEVLQDRLRQALDRAKRAEAQASEAGGTDDTLRRTLVLAQRTADLAVQEAREQAARILAGAEQQAQGMITDAEERARRAHEDTLADVRSQLAKLEASRQQLQLDVETLTRWVEEHKVHLSSALHDALARIEQTELLSPPPVSRVDLPPLRPTLSGSPAGGASMPGAGAAPGSPASATDAAPNSEGSEGVGADRPLQSRDAEDADAGGPPTMAWRPDDNGVVEGGEGDPYFAELRRAVNDHEPLGPRDDQEDVHAGVGAGTNGPGDEFFDQDFADVRRFGGRLRRRR